MKNLIVKFNETEFFLNLDNFETTIFNDQFLEELLSRKINYSKIIFIDQTVPSEIIHRISFFLDAYYLVNLDLISKRLDYNWIFAFNLRGYYVSCSYMSFFSKIKLKDPFSLCFGIRPDLILLKGIKQKIPKNPLDFSLAVKKTYLQSRLRYFEYQSPVLLELPRLSSFDFLRLFFKELLCLD